MSNFLFPECHLVWCKCLMSAKTMHFLQWHLWILHCKDICEFCTTITSFGIVLQWHLSILHCNVCSFYTTIAYMGTAAQLHLWILCYNAQWHVWLLRYNDVCVNYRKTWGVTNVYNVYLKEKTNDQPESELDSRTTQT